MKRKVYLFLFLAGLVVIYCCKRDSISHSSKTENELSMKSAKAFLEKNAQKFDGEELLVNIKSGQSLNSYLANGEIMWGGKKSFALNGHESLEVPFFTKRNTITLYNFRKLMYVESEADRKLKASYSYTNILFNKNKLTGAVQATLITYIPDRGAIEETGYYKTGKRMTLNELDTEFSGYIEYRTLKNEVTSVFYLERGILRRRYSPQATENMVQSYAAKSSQTCTTTCTPVYQTVCVSAPERGDGAEVCETKLIGQNCVETCTTNPDDPENPNPGGQTPNQPSYPTAQVQQFIANIFIPCPDMAAGTETRIKFEHELTDLLSGNYGQPFVCFTEKMLQFLSNQASSSGIKLGLCLDSVNTLAAGYSAATKRLTFNNNYSISSGLLFHELFHACQDRIYQDGISQYQNDLGRPDIEFETALLIDLLGRLGGYTNPEAVKSAEFKAFLDGLTKDSNNNRNLYNAKNYFADVTGQTSSYVYYKNQFKQDKGFGMLDNGLAPEAIKYFLNHFNCYL